MCAVDDTQKYRFWMLGQGHDSQRDVVCKLLIQLTDFKRILGSKFQNDPVSLTYVAFYGPSLKLYLKQ